MAKKIIYQTLHPDGREDIDLYPKTSVKQIVDYEGNALNSVVSIDQVSVSGLVHTYRITYSDGSTQDFQVSDGQNGINGQAGVSITGIEEVSDEVVGNQTLTTLRIHYSNGTSDEVVVYAQNGKSTIMNVITIYPNTATRGTFSDEDFSKLLNENVTCYLSLDAENYFLSGDEHEDNHLTYSHVGFYDSKYHIKVITVNMTTKMWVQDVIEVEEGTKDFYLTPESPSAYYGNLTEEKFNELLQYGYRGVVRISREGAGESEPLGENVSFYRLFRTLSDEQDVIHTLIYGGFGRAKGAVSDYYSDFNAISLIKVTKNGWYASDRLIQQRYKYEVTLKFAIVTDKEYYYDCDCAFFANTGNDIDDLDMFYDFFVTKENFIGGYILNAPIFDYSNDVVIASNGISQILSIYIHDNSFYICAIVDGSQIDYKLETQGTPDDSGIIYFNYDLY